MPNSLTKFLNFLFRRRHKKLHRHHCSRFENQPLLLLDRFELMPDELILEIFQYMDFIDLYSFVDLNFRLNFLLRQINISVCFNQSQNENQYLLKSLNYFHKQIVYIHFDYNPYLNLIKFSNLRSLTIYLPTVNQLMSIKHCFMPKLSRLSIGFMNKSDETFLWNNLFGSQQFSNLYFCNFFQVNFNENVDLFKKCSFIRKLFVKHCRTKDVLLILQHLPNLYQLEINLIDVSSNPLFENLNVHSYNRLKILKIEFLEKSSQLVTLRSILPLVPHVERFTVYLIDLFKIRDYDYLQKILIENLPELKRLICSIDYYCQLSSNQMIKKFRRLKHRDLYFQSIKIIPCHIHRDKCLRKIWINQTFQNFSSI